MKHSLLSIIILLTGLISMDAFAHRDRVKKCKWKTNRYGDRVKQCRYVDRKHSHNRDSDLSDVEAGIIIGAGAVMLAQSCAPDVVDSNVNVTDKTLNKLLVEAEFAKEEKFVELVSSISAETNVEKKMSRYFAMIGATTTEDVAFFIGARDEDMPKYEASLSKSTGLSAEKAKQVVALLNESLKGNLN